MVDLMPMELWAMTFSNLDYKDLRRCMLVSKCFQELTQDPKLRSTLFRGTVVSTLTSYYQFLVSLYLPQSEVEYPPAEGWSRITKESYLARYCPSKTDEVIDLARSMPYVQGLDEWNQPHQIYPTLFCSGKTGHCPAKAIADLPPSVFCIAEPQDGDGYYLFLDVEQETVTVVGSENSFMMRSDSPYKPITRIESFAKALKSEKQEGEAQECEDQDWRKEPTYRVSDFFEELKWRFRELIIQPSGRGTQVVLGTPEKKAILNKHGWPSSSYDKIACIDELKAYAAEQDSD